MKAILSSRRHHYVAGLSIFLVVATLMAGLVGCGSRPAVDAIEIRDWYDLQAISNNMTVDYILVNDLDRNTPGYTELASPTANEGNGWEPIAGIGQPRELQYFSGLFDGQGHEIKDLFINRPDGYRVGLFHYTNFWGVIRNVGVVNANVTGGERVGGLVGQVAMSTVSNSYFTGTVAGSHIVGGLAGGIWAGGTVTDSYATGAVIGGNSTGGLLGFSDNGCTVSRCYFDGTVTGYDTVGGLVGSASDDGNVSDSYSTGNVTGDNAVGGLVGANWGTVSNSYSTVSVAGDLHVGGLAGSNNYTVSNCYATGRVSGGEQTGGLVGTHQGGTIDNSYATGNVTGSWAVGGLVGANLYCDVSNSFWDIETSGQATSDGGTGKNTTEVKDIITFTDTETEGLDEPWDIVAVADPGARDLAYIWNIVDDVTYPFLSWEP